MRPNSATIDNVLQDVRALSSGTMAALIRELAVPNVHSARYEVVERLSRAFSAHVEGAGAGRFSNWQDAWASFRATPQAVEAAAGGPVYAEGASVQYELHFWDGRPKTHHSSLTELDVAFRAAVATAPLGDDGQLEAVVYRRRGERALIARTHGHRLADGRAEVRPLAGWEDAEMLPMPPIQKAAPTFAELFNNARESLRRLADSWHRARGQTPTEYLRLFSSLTPAEELVVVRNLRAVVPADGEPMGWLISRRAITVQRALDHIQETRGRPPIMAGPPPGGDQPGYMLTEGDHLEVRRIAAAVIKFYGTSTPTATVKTEADSDGWNWVRVCDMDGLPLTMGTGGFQVGAVQCANVAEAAAMASALSTEIRRVADGAAMGPMPRHIARRLNPEPISADVQAAPEPEEPISWGYRR